MKKSILLLVATIIIGCCTIASANITTLGTIEYESFMQTSISSPTEVNFTLIYSTMDEETLTIDKIGFIPALNETKFVFTSNAVDPEWWWMNLSIEPFIFQDKNTLELYKIYIDYSDVEVPPIPSDIELAELQIIFNETFNNLQQSMINLTNISNQYNLTFDELMQLRYYYNNTFDNYTNLGIDYNKTLLEIAKLNINLTNAVKDYLKMYDAYNRSAVNASLYTDFYNQMLSDWNTFWFADDYGNHQYRTFDSYEDEIEEKNGVLGMFPAYIFFSVTVTMIFTLMFAFKKWGEKKKKLYDDTEKPPKMVTRINSFFFSKILRKKANPANNSMPANTNPSTTETVQIKPPSSNFEEILKSQFKANIEPIHNRLDNIEKDQKTLKTGYKDLAKQVDSIITKKATPTG